MIIAELNKIFYNHIIKINMLQSQKMIIVCNTPSKSKKPSVFCNTVTNSINNSKFVQNLQASHAKNKHNIIAQGKSKNVQHKYNSSKSVNLSHQLNPQKQLNNNLAVSKSSNNFIRKKSFNLYEQHQINKRHRKSFSLGTDKGQYSANIINIASNIENDKIGKPIPSKYKSSYCKRITMSNLQKYYKYCVSKIKDKDIILQKLKQQKQDQIKRYAEQNWNQNKQIHSKRYEQLTDNQFQQNPKEMISNLLTHSQNLQPQILKNHFYQRLNNKKIQTSSNFQKHDRPKRQSFSQHMNRQIRNQSPFLHKKLKKNIKSNNAQNKEQLYLSPWDAPDLTNFDQIQL